MKNFYVVVRNFLLFFFLVTVFNGIHISQGLFGLVVAAILFGVFMMLVPSILGFFKLPVNFGGMFLLSLVISFIFLLLIYSNFLNLGSITGSTINWGISGLVAWQLDALSTIVVVSIVASLLGVWLDKTATKK